MDLLHSDTALNDIESALIDSVVGRVRERLPPDEAAQCEVFVRQ